jgi:dTDP-4-dehydrorhamnose reductase
MLTFEDAQVTDCMAKMRALVTGASGMLGSDLIPVLTRHGYAVLATDINLRQGVRLLDVRDYSSVRKIVSRFKPSWILHLAAETDLERCESDPTHAYSTNVVGTENVVIACREYNIPMVYISTAGVFDGSKVNSKGEPKPYTEFDKPTPINVYGMSKYQGEKIVAQQLSRYFIIRAGWMIGGLERDKKFVSKILIQLRERAKVIHAVDDKYGTPTYTLNFARAIISLIGSPYYGLYHAACTGSGTRYDIAKEILRLLRRSDVALVPVPSDYFKEEYPAPRPASEIMRNFKLELRGMNIMPTWQEALEHYLTRWGLVNK